MKRSINLLCMFLSKRKNHRMSGGWFGGKIKNLLFVGAFLFLGVNQHAIGQTVVIHPDFSEDGVPTKDDDGTGTKNGVVVWKGGGTVHVVLVWYSVEKGQTLEIRPGAIVKMARAFQVDASGKVISWQSGGYFKIGGEGLIKIDGAIITEISDDSEGGDTNQDEGKSLPYAGEYNIDISGTSKGYIKTSTIKYSSIQGFGSLNYEENKFLMFESWGYNSINPQNDAVPIFSRNTFEFNGYSSCVRFSGVAPIVEGNTFGYAKDAVINPSSLGPALRIVLWTDPSNGCVYPQSGTAIIANNLFKTDCGIDITPSPDQLSKVHGFRVEIRNNILSAPGLNQYKGETGLNLSFNATMIVTNNEVEGYRWPLKIAYYGNPMDLCGLQINTNHFSKSPLPGSWTVYGPPESIWKKGITINAKNNYWGDPSGPRDYSDADGLSNERGLGIEIEDGIDYVPFIGGTTQQSKDVVYISASSTPAAPLLPKATATLNVEVTNYQLKSASSGIIDVAIRDKDGIVLNQQSSPINVTSQNHIASFPSIQIQVPELTNVVTVEAALAPDGGGETVNSNVVPFLVQVPPSAFKITGMTDADAGGVPIPIRGNKLKLKVDFKYTYAAGNVILEIAAKERTMGNGTVLKEFPSVSSLFPPGTNQTNSETIELDIPLRDVLVEPKADLYCQVTMKTEGGSEIGKDGVGYTINPGGSVRIEFLAPAGFSGLPGSMLYSNGRDYYEIGEYPAYGLLFGYDIKTKSVSDWVIWLGNDEALDAKRNVIYQYTSMGPVLSDASTGSRTGIKKGMGAYTAIPSGTKTHRIFLQLKTPGNMTVAFATFDIEVRDKSVRTARKAVPAGASQVAFNPIPTTLNFTSNQNAGTAFAEEFAGQFGSSPALAKQNMLMKVNDFYWNFIPLKRYWSVYDTLKDGTFSATLSFTYDPATDFPAAPGFNEDSLIVAGLNPLSEELEALPSTLDKVTHTITTGYTKFFDTYVVASKATLLTAVSSPRPFQLPEQFSIEQNYPNPFNPSTTIRYQLPVENLVNLKVFDMNGREVAALVNERKPAGFYQVVWNAEGLPNGVYFCRLQAGEIVETKKLILLK